MMGLYFKEAKRALCPYCSKKMKAELLSIAMFRRTKYQCTRCFKELYICDADNCHNYVKSDKDGSAYCFICATIPPIQDNYLVGDDYTDYAGKDTQYKDDNEYTKKHVVPDTSSPGDVESNFWLFDTDSISSDD